MNVNDFLIWWDGFSAAINPRTLTVDQWETIDNKIRSIKNGNVVNNLMPAMFPGIQIGDPVILPRYDYQPSPFWASDFQLQQ